MLEQIQAIILGAIQGITEFIPVSSSGHLMLAGKAMGDTANLHLLVQALDFGTVIALVIFFRKKIWRIIHQACVQHDYRLLRNIIITSLPVCTLGLLLHKLIEHMSCFTLPLAIAIALGLVGIVMIVIERLPHLSSVDNATQLSASRALLIGIAQCFALIPGVSRSGSTIIAGKLVGLDSRNAAEYSFIASLPVMFALMLKLFVTDHAYLINNFAIITLGNVFAFICGMATIKVLLSYLSNHGLKLFGKYRVLLSVVIILAVLFGLL